jgi:hypothetical protein
MRKWKLAGEERRSEKIGLGRTRKIKPVTAISIKSRTKSQIQPHKINKGKANITHKIKIDFFITIKQDSYNRTMEVTVPPSFD